MTKNIGMKRAKKTYIMSIYSNISEWIYRNQNISNVGLKIKTKYTEKKIGGGGGGGGMFCSDNK